MPLANPKGLKFEKDYKGWKIHRYFNLHDRHDLMFFAAFDNSNQTTFMSPPIDTLQEAMKYIDDVTTIACCGRPPH